MAGAPGDEVALGSDPNGRVAKQDRLDHQQDPPDEKKPKRSDEKDCLGQHPVAWIVAKPACRNEMNVPAIIGM